jgi:hypothetical protein
MVLDTTKQYSNKQLIDNVKAVIGIEGLRLPTKSLNMTLLSNLPKAKSKSIILLLQEFMALEEHLGITYVSPTNNINGELFEPFQLPVTSSDNAKNTDKSKKPKASINWSDLTPKQQQIAIQLAKKQDKSLFKGLILKMKQFLKTYF